MSFAVFGNTQQTNNEIYPEFQGLQCFSNFILYFVFFMKLLKINVHEHTEVSAWCIVYNYDDFIYLNVASHNNRTELVISMQCYVPP